MAHKDYVYPLVLSSVNTNGIAIDTMTPFDAAGIEEDVFMIRITNDSDTTVYISFNGTDDHECVPDGETIEVNFQANASPPNYKAMLKKGTVLYVNGNPGTGLVYLAGYYNGR